MHALLVSIYAFSFVAILAKPLGPLDEYLQGPFDPVSLDPSSYDSGSSDSSSQDSIFLDSTEGTHSRVSPNFFDYPETTKNIQYRLKD